MWKIILLILAALYTLNPYDILPDFMAGWGWLDDLIIWILVWRYFVSLKSASIEEIKHAYRELAAKYHPDKLEYLGEEFRVLAEMRFKEIQQAYQELTAKRS
ncbi:MAG: DnaJ domain-containing protein [Deltaproteobacteria bacterium]